jgi:hypothetical protein
MTSISNQLEEASGLSHKNLSLLARIRDSEGRYWNITKTDDVNRRGAKLKKMGLIRFEPAKGGGVYFVITDKGTEALAGSSLAESVGRIRSGSKYRVDGTTYRAFKHQRPIKKKGWSFDAPWTLSVRDDDDEDRPWNIHVHGFATAEAIEAWLNKKGAKKV